MVIWHDYSYLCFWCNAICLYVLRLKNFSYIIVAPLWPAFQKCVFYKTNCSEKHSVLWLASWPVRYVWLNISSMWWKCYGPYHNCNLLGLSWLSVYPWALLFDEKTYCICLAATAMWPWSRPLLWKGRGKITSHLSDTRFGLVLTFKALITRLSYQEKRFGLCPREPTKQENHCLDT